MLNHVPPELIQGELCRRSLKEFIKYFWKVVEPTTPFVDNWHLDCFVDHLANIKQIKNLLVNVPPSTSKSLIFCVFFPAYLWLHDPSARLLYASYSMKLSERDSLKCRKLIGSDLYQRAYNNPFYFISDTKAFFENDKTGFRQAISVGSATKGLKGNYLICDDPHNSDDADSDEKKSICRNWFVDGFYDRLCNFNDDVRCVIGQRIARDDLSGFILENYKSEWTHLCLPYEYRTQSVVNPIGWTDPRTEEGEPLWAARFPDSQINQLKKKPYVWSTQWNQQPTDPENCLFKPENFRYYEDTADGYRLGDRTVAKSQSYRIISADLAASVSKRSDYTAIMVIDLCYSGDMVVVHCVREKIPPPKIVTRMIELNALYHPAYLLVEDTVGSKMIIDQMRLEGLPVRGIRPGGVDKEGRSLSLQSRFWEGQVWFPREKSWRSALESELIEFPLGAFDDQCDCLVYASIEAGKRIRPRPASDDKPAAQSEAERYAKAITQGLF